MPTFCLPSIIRVTATSSAVSSCQDSNPVVSASAAGISGAVVGELSSSDFPLPALLCIPSPSADTGRGGSRLDRVKLKADA